MRIAALVCLAAAISLSGCTIGGVAQTQSTPSASIPAPLSGQVDVAATITQQRRDQIKRVVSLRITVGGSVTENFGDRRDPISITDVRLVAPGFVRQPEVAWNHRPVLIQSNVPVALPITLADPDCTDATPRGPSGAIVTFDDELGQSRSITLAALEDDGLLDRIRLHDCAVASLEGRATFTLGSDWRPAQLEGQRVWLGSVDIARTRPFGSPVEVIGALGSVLVDFTPVAPFPWRVPDERQSRLPIVASSSGRCDGHSMGESSKPFVFTLWVRADGADVPLVLAVPTADLAIWWSLLASACDEIRGSD